ncbi:MAG: hypothetical protein JWM99_3876 [Verrucomicrobiales bacterium]|nr:hypothetical protein [Verrucomicrobiales bacterium]
MHVTDLAINKSLGISLAPENSEHILEMRETPLLLNHIGTIHASVLFAFAEASSGELLLRHLGEAQNQFFAVLRTSEVKFRKPAHGALRAFARLADGTLDSFSSDLKSRGRALASILVELLDGNGVATIRRLKLPGRIFSLEQLLQISNRRCCGWPGSGWNGSRVNTTLPTIALAGRRNLRNERKRE